MSSPESPENKTLESEEHLNISQVGNNRNKQQLSPVVLTLIFLIIVALILFVAFSGEDEKKEIKFTEEEYRTSSSHMPTTPQAPIKPTIPNELVLEKESDTGLSPEELQALKRAEALRFKRLHSSIIAVNRKPQIITKFKKPKKSNQDHIIELRKSADSRINDLLRNTANATNAQNSNSSTNKQTITNSSNSLKNLDTGDFATISAAYMSDRNFKLSQGKIIPAILETAIQSDLSGMLRGIVSESVYSENGNILLIPTGSRLIGEYQSGMNEGQVRIFVIWTRLIRPDGINIKIDSPNTDSIGLAGIGGYVDSHFFERFGASVMMSLISGFSQSGTDNDRQTVAVSDSFAKSAETILNKQINIPPTLHVLQGVKINVFIAKDLNFKKALFVKSQFSKLGLHQ